MWSYFGVAETKKNPGGRPRLSPGEETEMRKVLDVLQKTSNRGKHRHSSYEEGVRDTLRWVLGEEEAPIEDEE